jgi:cytochrome c oxidase assembly factor CtaG
MSVVPLDASSAVRAHPGLPPEPHDLLTAWSLEPAVLLCLIMCAWLYARGVRALWHRAGRGRVIPGWRVLAFVGGVLTLVVALFSPIVALGTALFSVHMLQHMLLMLVAAPLLVLSKLDVALLWVFPPAARRRIGIWWRRRATLRAAWRGLIHPAVVWVLHAATIWLWHLPGPYQAALVSPIVHSAEHASFLGTALLFWWILPGIGPHARLHPAIGVLFLFSFALQGGLLGALMTFSGTPWYPAYAATTAAWGLTPLDDQQLAGMIMWVPAGLVYLVAALLPLARWLDAGSEPAPLREREQAV